MKQKLLLATIATLFAMSAIAQGNSSMRVNLGLAKIFSETVPEGDEVIVGYKVEERINLRFGGRITTYKVPSLSMVSQVDLGPDNRRIITPIYGKAKPKPVVAASQMAIAGMAPKAVSAPVAGKMKIGSGIIRPIKRKILVEPDAEDAETKKPAPIMEVSETEKPTPIMEVVETNPDGTTRTAKINILHTYERTLERGYQSADMLRRVANLRFFEGDLAKAGKWYGELYKLNPNNWEPIMYFRYAQCLKAANQHAKADEMMKIYKAKDI